MSLARVIGLSGNITLPSGYALAVARGTCNLFSTPVDVTNATTSGGSAEVLGGVKRAAGTAMGYVQSGNVSGTPGWATIPAGNTPQTAGNMTYNIASGCNYAFGAIISNIRFDWDYAGRQTATFSFMSSGNITESWA